MGKLLFVFCEACRKLGGGVDVAEEDVGERLSSADAGVPHLEDTFDMIDPWHADGAAGFEHDDGVVIAGGYCIDEGILVAGEREGFSVHVFVQRLVGEDNGERGGLCK